MARRHDISLKRRRRKAIGWMILSVVLLVLLFVAAVCRVAGETADAEEREPVYFDATMEEDTLHPQDYEPPFTAWISDAEITQAAQVVWGEARGIHSRMEQAAVVWCLLNRVDVYGDSLGKIVTAPGQFHYDASFPTVDDYGRDLEELVRDVVDRWEREKNGEADVGRVLPQVFLYFGGENGRNWFRDTLDFYDDTLIWDWRFPDPYV